MVEPEASAGPELPERLGPFAVSAVLGEGGSAVVYAARFRDMDVAVKVAKSERELTDREAERFLEEARMLARVRHGSVVEVLDSGRLDDGRPYLVMRRYRGETLAEHLAREGALELPHALSLFAELADATATLHDAGLLHRDLKPENVFLVDDGTHLKLLDFGIAKEIAAPASTTTQAGIARGTPATMAPERFFGAAASELTDVYELAVVLYAMVVGRLPWTDATNVNARLNPVSPAEAGAHVPEALSSEIVRALSTRPERRPRSVRELAERVQAAASGKIASGRVTAETVVTAPALTGSHRSDGAHIIDSKRSVPPPSRRSRGPIAAIALGVAALVGAALLLRAGPAEEPAAAAAPASPEPAPPAPAPPPEPAAEPPKPEPVVAAPEPPAEPEKKTKSTKPRAKAAPTASAPPKPTPGPTRGKPKGAPCTRSSECASMLCAAETCQ